MKKKPTAISLTFLLILILFLNIVEGADRTPLGRKVVVQFYEEGLEACEGDSLDVIKKIIKENYQDALDNIWRNRFSPNLPRCMQEVLDWLKNVKTIPIVFYPSTVYLSDEICCKSCVSLTSNNIYENGQYTDNGSLAGFYSGKIIFHGIWNKRIGKNKEYSLDGLMLHELIHFTLYKLRHNPLYDHIHTSYLEKWEHEGVAEDCSLKLFNDAPTGHADSNDGKNPPGDDCECKKICIPCKDYCPPDECDPECPEGGKGGGGHGPGNDNADDRYSFSEGIVREYNLAPEAVIFTDGYWQDALKLYGGLKFDGDNAAEQLLEATPFLVIPSGGLFGKENDSTLKHVLEQYVNLGGTIIVFCQQFGSHVENVVPGGESLKVYGWRQDQRVSS